MSDELVNKVNALLEPMGVFVRCGQSGCERKANSKIYWPGRPPLLSCIECAAKALRIADTMGFDLTVEELR